MSIDGYGMPMDFPEQSARGDAELLASELGPGWKPWTRRVFGLWEYGARYSCDEFFIDVRALIPENAAERLMYRAQIDGYPGAEAVHENPKHAVRRAMALLRIHASRVRRVYDEGVAAMLWIEEPVE